MKTSGVTGQGLSGERLHLRYQEHQRFIIAGESLEIPRGRITALIGPNGSGKSTLLKALARQLPPASGRVALDGREIASFSACELARKLGILFQERHAPDDLTVEELVWHGRYPHRRLFEPATAADDTAVNRALRMAGIEEFRHTPIGHLSGGQKQLAWIAMAVAQSPEYLLLDEPTTFLDPANQFDVMDLLVRLNREMRMTTVLVLHDLNLAARYAQYVFALNGGRILACGPVERVLTEEVIRRVFGVHAVIVLDETMETFFCILTRRASVASDGRLVGQ